MKESERIIDCCVSKRTTQYLVRSGINQETSWLKKNQVTDDQVHQYNQIINGEPNFVPVSLKIQDANLKLSFQQEKIVIQIKRKIYHKAKEIPHESRRTVIEELQSLFWCLIQK